MAVNRRIVLASRPVGMPTAENFRLEEDPVPEPGTGRSWSARSGCRSTPTCAGG